MANIKLGSNEIKKFIEIYRSHECLWDTNNINYKNRNMRNSALSSFAEELDIDGFGVKEITNKIKNIRSQYLQEKKKIRTSKGTGTSADEVYHPKLKWFNLLNSFVMTNTEPKGTSSNLDFNDDAQVLVEKHSEKAVSRSQSALRDMKVLKMKKSNNNVIQSTLDKLDSIAQAASVQEDEIDKFGSYVAASLRKLKTFSSIKAQDEIQAVLSKYRLTDISVTPSTPMPESPHLNSVEASGDGM